MPLPDPLEAEPPRHAAVTPIPSDCVLTTRALETPAIHPGLLAVAPQYFHAPHRGGFDAFTGGTSFPWFDVHSLGTPIESPPGSRISASTASSLFPVSGDRQLGVQARAGGAVRWSGQALYPEQAVDGHEGHRFVLAHSGTTWQVVDFDDANEAHVYDLGVPETTWDVRLAVTHDGQPAVAWLERQGGRLRVMLSMDFTGRRTVSVDEVEVPVGVAELSQRTSVDLALTASGPRGLAVAWRPLVDTTYTDFGDRSTPPTTAAAAAVRWLEVKTNDGRPTVHSHQTRAHPLGGVSGVGPWALSSNGMKAATFGGRGLFVWHDDGAIYAVGSHQSTPVALLPGDGAPLLTFRETDQGLELLLLDSSPRVRAVAIACAPP